MGQLGWLAEAHAGSAACADSSGGIDLAPTAQGVLPAGARHVEPAEFHAMLAEAAAGPREGGGKPTVLVDTRNFYETRIGRFQAVGGAGGWRRAGERRVWPRRKAWHCAHTPAWAWFCAASGVCSSLAACQRLPCLGPDLMPPSAGRDAASKFLFFYYSNFAGSSRAAGPRGALLLRHPRLAGGQPAPPGQPPHLDVLHRGRQVGRGRCPVG